VIEIGQFQQVGVQSPQSPIRAPLAGLAQKLETRNSCKAHVELQFYTGAEWVRTSYELECGGTSAEIQAFVVVYFRRQQTQNPASRPCFLTEAGSPSAAVIPRTNGPLYYWPVKAGSLVKKMLLSTIYGLILVPEGVQVCNTVRFPSLHTCGNRRLIESSLELLLVRNPAAFSGVSQWIGKIPVPRPSYP